MPDAAALPDFATLRALALDAGLCAFAAAPADPFDDVRVTIETRRARGLHAGMQFTYRNPARSTDPSRTVPGARTLLVGAYDYQRQQPPRPAGPVGRVAAYSWDDHYAALRAALERVAEPLRAAGHRAIVLADQNNLVDRAAAHRAGLGWWGKSSNILIPGVGSLVVLGAVLTDAAVASPAPEPVADGCGGCRRCLDGCPTGAIVAPGVIDARRCLSWLLQTDGPFPVEYRAALGDRLYGCDDCQDVCPPNQVRRRRPSATGADGAWVDVAGALALDDDTLMARFGRWYVPRRDPAALRRNLLVVLANVGDAADPRTAAAVAAAWADERPLVRAHAVWAARRLDLVEVLVGVEDDTDPWVAREWGRDDTTVAAASAR